MVHMLLRRLRETTQGHATFAQKKGCHDILNWLLIITHNFTQQ